MSIEPETNTYKWVDQVRKKQIQNLLSQKKASPSPSFPSLQYFESFPFISSLRESIFQETSPCPSSPPLPHSLPLFPSPLSLFHKTQQNLQRLLFSSCRLLSLSPSGFLSFATPHMLEMRERMNQEGREGEEKDDFLPDFVGVYAFPAESLLSLSPPPDFIDLPLEEEGGRGGGGGGGGGKPVYSRGMRLYSVKKAMLLLLGGNHRLLESLLFSPFTYSLSASSSSPSSSSSSPSSSSFSTPPSKTAITTTAWEQITTIITPLVRTESLFRHYEGLINQNITKVNQFVRKKRGKRGGGEVGELGREVVREVGENLFHALRFFFLPFLSFFFFFFFFFRLISQLFQVINDLLWLFLRKRCPKITFL